jgi:hypothetical protein
LAFSRAGTGVLIAGVVLDADCPLLVVPARTFVAERSLVSWVADACGHPSGIVAVAMVSAFRSFKITIRCTGAVLVVVLVAALAAGARKAGVAGDAHAGRRTSGIVADFEGSASHNETVAGFVWLAASVPVVVMVSWRTAVTTVASVASIAEADSIATAVVAGPVTAACALLTVIVAAGAPESVRLATAHAVLDELLRLVAGIQPIDGVFQADQHASRLARPVLGTA